MTKNYELFGKQEQQRQGGGEKMNAYDGGGGMSTAKWINLGIPEPISQGLSIPPIQTAELLQANSRKQPLFFRFQTINFAYSSIGLARNIVDIPIDDAYRGELEITSDQLNADDIKFLKRYIRKKDLMQKFKNSVKWARAFGGSGLIVMVNGEKNITKPLNIKKGDELFFQDDYLWNLNTNSNVDFLKEPILLENEKVFFWRQQAIDSSRVVVFKGLPAVGIMRDITRGWGLCVFDRTLAGINLLDAWRNAFLELLNKQNLDILSVDQLTNALGTPQGQAKLKQVAKDFNNLKSIYNTVFIDSKNTLSREQIDLQGPVNSFECFCKMIACDSRISLTRLFGDQSKGISNGGEADQDNYIAMVEGEIRETYYNQLTQAIDWCCLACFGYVPDDLMVKLPSLKIESQINIEAKKTSQANRLVSFINANMCSAEEAREIAEQWDLMPQLKGDDND